VKPSKWKTVKPTATGEALAVVSYLSLASFRSLPLFIHYAFKVQLQLGKSKGLIGYSTHARFLSRKFWTLSIWENEQSLRAFVEQSAHGASMKSLDGKADDSGFTSWPVNGSALALDWADARERLAHAKSDNGN
jgi:hypothetical protein